jgi:hypothetical protein
MDNNIIVYLVYGQASRPYTVPAELVQSTRARDIALAYSGGENGGGKRRKRRGKEREEKKGREFIWVGTGDFSDY